MATCFLLPDPVQSTFFIPGGNTPGNGVQVGFFVNLSSTPTTVYKDSAGSVAWPNPIVLDSGGNLPLGGTVWVPSGVTVTVKWAPANDVFPFSSPYRTIDGLTGIGDSSAGASTSDWVSGPTPTFVSGTSFTLPGDQTLLFTNGRRIKTTNTGGTVYSTITSVGFGGGITTVRVVNDALTLDSGISAVFYGLIDPSASSIDFYHVSRNAGTVTTGANGTTDIWGVAGTLAGIVGTNAIFSFSTSPYTGAVRWVIAQSAFPINSSNAISTPGNVNITTTPGDRFTVVASTNSFSIITDYNSNQPILYTPQTSGLVFAGPASGTSSVAPSFRPLAGSESAYVLLASKAANNTSQIFITTSDINWVNYSEYELRFVDFVCAANANLSFQISRDGGTTYVSSATYGSTLFRIDGGTNTVSTVAGLSVGVITPSTQSSGALNEFNGVLSLKNPSNASSFKYMIGYNMGFINISGLQASGISMNNQASTGPYNGLKILYSTGNIQSGTVNVYGIKNS